MAFDYKKEYKEFYMPKNKPGIIDIPKMNYIAVREKGKRIQKFNRLAVWHCLYHKDELQGNA